MANRRKAGSEETIRSLKRRMSGVAALLLQRLGLVSDVLEGERASYRFFQAFLLLFVIGMILVSLFGEQGLIAYFRMKNEVARMGEQVEALQEKKETLILKIRALREDQDYVELLARQKLGLVKPGELIIQLPGGETP